MLSIDAAVGCWKIWVLKLKRPDDVRYRKEARNHLSPPGSPLDLCHRKRWAGSRVVVAGTFPGVAAAGAPGAAGSRPRPGGGQGALQGDVALCLFRLTMLAYVLGGMAGFWFHIGANMDFELEMYSRLSGWDLVSRTARGALPVLAPGALIQLGLIGYLYTHRHPDPGAGRSEKY